MFQCVIKSPSCIKIILYLVISEGFMKKIWHIFQRNKWKSSTHLTNFEWQLLILRHTQSHVEVSSLTSLWHIIAYCKVVKLLSNTCFCISIWEDPKSKRKRWNRYIRWKQFLFWSKKRHGIIIDHHQFLFIESHVPVNLYEN